MQFVLWNSCPAYRMECAYILGLCLKQRTHDVRHSMTQSATSYELFAVSNSMNTKFMTGPFDCLESCLKHIRQQSSIFSKWRMLPYIFKLHSQHPRVFELTGPGFSGLVPTLSAHTAVAVCPDSACHTSKNCVNVILYF